MGKRTKQVRSGLANIAIMHVQFYCTLHLDALDVNKFNDPPSEISPKVGNDSYVELENAHNLADSLYVREIQNYLRAR